MRYLLSCFFLLSLHCCFAQEEAVPESAAEGQMVSEATQAYMRSCETFSITINYYHEERVKFARSMQKDVLELFPELKDKKLVRKEADINIELFMERPRIINEIPKLVAAGSGGPTYLVEVVYEQPLVVQVKSKEGEPIDMLYSEMVPLFKGSYYNLNAVQKRTDPDTQGYFMYPDKLPIQGSRLQPIQTSFKPNFERQRLNLRENLRVLVAEWKKAQEAQAKMVIPVEEQQ
jgi:hypothetical protein